MDQSGGRSLLVGTAEDIGWMNVSKRAKMGDEMVRNILCRRKLLRTPITPTASVRRLIWRRIVRVWGWLRGLRKLTRVAKLLVESWWHLLVGGIPAPVVASASHGNFHAVGSRRRLRLGGHS